MGWMDRIAASECRLFSNSLESVMKRNLVIAQIHASLKEYPYFQQQTLSGIKIHKIKFVLHAAHQRLNFRRLKQPC